MWPIGVLLVLALVGSVEALLCDGNRFFYYSSYMLDRQKDLNETFNEINSSITVGEVQYQDNPYRSYRIFNFRPVFSYQESKQTSSFRGNNVLQIANGSARISYAFDWEKTQLGSSLYGKGTGSVSSDDIVYQKTLFTNKSHELQWFLSDSHNVSISKGLALTTIDPYRDRDYEIISNMLNSLPESQTTVKLNLLKAINTNFISILADKVLHDKVAPFRFRPRTGTARSATPIPATGETSKFHTRKPL